MAAAPPQVLPWPLRACHGLGIPPTRHARASPACPRRAATAPQAACTLGRPQGPCCLPQGRASVPTQACQGLGCVPWPCLLAHGGCLGLGCCMPRPSLLLAHGELPWPWLLHAQAFAATCPWGAALALAALALALALAAACPHIWSDFLKMRVFRKVRLFSPRRPAVGIPEACPRARRAASPRIVPHSGKIGPCLFPFYCP